MVFNACLLICCFISTECVSIRKARASIHFSQGLEHRAPGHHVRQQKAPENTRWRYELDFLYAVLMKDFIAESLQANLATSE